MMVLLYTVATFLSLCTYLVIHPFIFMDVFQQEFRGFGCSGYLWILYDSMDSIPMIHGKYHRYMDIPWIYMDIPWIYH